MDTKVDCKVDRLHSPLPRWAYHDGRIVRYREASFGLLTHGLNYGTGLFAGIRGYWNAEEGQLFVFRPEDHFRRFLDSARLLRMRLDLTPDDLTRGLIDLLRAEGYRENCYVRPVAFYGDETIGVRLHGLTPVVGMSSVPFGSYLGRDDGIHAAVSSWTRVSDNVIPARGKLAGFDEALLLNQHGHVCEGSVENVFVVRGGAVATPPVTDDVLEGFTRATAIQILREDLGRTVIERSIDRTELYLAEEVFLTGTGAEISPVTRIDHRAIGSGQIGPIAAALRERYLDTTGGRVAKYRDWCRPVYASVPAGEPAAMASAASRSATAT